MELAGALKRRQETQVASPVALRRHGGQDLVAAGLERFFDYFEGFGGFAGLERFFDVQK